MDQSRIDRWSSVHLTVLSTTCPHTHTNTVQRYVHGWYPLFSYSAKIRAGESHSCPSLNKAKHLQRFFSFMIPPPDGAHPCSLVSPLTLSLSLSQLNGGWLPAKDGGGVYRLLSRQDLTRNFSTTHRTLVHNISQKPIRSDRRIK